MVPNRLELEASTIRVFVLEIHKRRQNRPGTDPNHVPRRSAPTVQIPPNAQSAQKSQIAPCPGQRQNEINLHLPAPVQGWIHWVASPFCKEAAMARRITCPRCGGAGRINNLPEGKCGNCFGTGSIDAPEERNDRLDGCFPAGTTILTPTGTRPIEQLVPGDEVCSWVEDGGLGLARVTRVKGHAPHRILRVEFEDALTLRVTRRHLLKSAAGWIRAGSLTPGLRLWGVRSDGSVGIRVVSRCVVTEDVERVFNLNVEPHCAFVAGHCVAHSFAFLRRTREFLAQLRHWDIDDARRQGSGQAQRA